LKKSCPQGHVLVKRHMNVPVFDGSRIVLVAGVGNKEEEYDQNDARQLTLIMEGVWRLLERKRAEEMLRLKNLVFDASLAANSIADLNGVITEANGAFLRMWGYPDREEVVGKPLPHFLDDPNEGAAILTALNGTGQWEGDYSARRRDGSVFLAHGLATTLRDTQGSVVGYQSAVLDVTEHRQAEEALKIERDNLDAIFASSPVAMLLLDEVTNVVRANAAAVALTGGNGSNDRTRPGDLLGCVHSSQDPRGCGYSKTCGLCPVRNGIEAMLAHGGAMHDVELPLELMRNGIPLVVWMQFGAEVLTVSGRRLVCISLSDVSERKLADESLRARNEELERFYRAGVGREMRMIELKQELNELCQQAGLAPRYPSAVKKP